MGDLSFDVKILADRKIDIRQRKFAGTQGDVLPCKITFDVSAIGTEGKQFKIEWHGCADTYEETVLLEAVEGKVTAPVPKSIIDAGGTATAYLLEEVVSETGLVQRICSLPVRLYLGNKATGDTSATISEYNRDTTEMYLAVVNEKKKNDEIVNEAKELAQDSKNAKENYDSAKALYDANVASVGSAKDSAESASESADNASTSETNANRSAERAKSYFEQTQEIAQGADGVRYNSKQELTDEQKAQARGNIGAIGSVGEIPYNNTLKTDENNLLGVNFTDGKGLKMGVNGLEVDENIYPTREYVNGKFELIGSTAVDLSGYAKLKDLDAYDLPRNIRIESYDGSSVIVGFETGNGSGNETRYDIDLSIDGKFDVYIYKIAIDGGGYSHGIASETIENAVARVYAFDYVVENGEVTYLSTDGVNYLLEEQIGSALDEIIKIQEDLLVPNGDEVSY